MRTLDLPQGWKWLPESPESSRPFRAREDMTEGAEDLPRITLEGRNKTTVIERAHTLAKLPKPRAIGSAGSLEEAVIIAVAIHYGINDMHPERHKGYKSVWHGEPTELAAYLLRQVADMPRQGIAAALGVSASHTAITNADRASIGEDEMQGFIDCIERLLGYRITTDA